MRAQEEPTYESTQMKAHLGEHTYESTRGEHTEESTHMRLRSPNAQGQGTRAILCGNLKEKCRTPSAQEPFYVDIYRKSAGPRSRGARLVWQFIGKKRTWTLQKSHFAWKFTGKHIFRARHFVRACAIETHIDASEEPFFAVIYTKNAGPQFRVAGEFGELVVVVGCMQY